MNTDTAYIYGGWFPAAVTLPDGQTWHRCRIYLGTNGVTVYSRPGVCDWSSPIDHKATAEPDFNARQVGIDVHTEAGLVIITPGNGCGCGMPLKRWRPEFSHRVAPWPT